VCNKCRTLAGSIYRCKTCLVASQYCAPCLLSAHQHQATHRVEYWDDSTWTETSLTDLGYILYLGHRGSTCSQSNATSKLLIGDLNGFCSVNLQYCTHPDAPSKALQLLAAGLFPCSDLHPRSAFTTSLLDTYNVFLTLGRTSAHKFYSVLERITKPGFPEDVKDRYRELMAAHRKYLYLMNLQRSGHGFERHRTDGPAGDQALDCVACPRPGINFEWEEVSDSERYFSGSIIVTYRITFLVFSVWFRSFLSYDGNFRSVRKSKKVDQGDVCLSDGLAYFPAKQEYKEWTEAQSQPQRTVNVSFVSRRLRTNLSSILI
jgi:hypothetical protein